MLVVGDSTDRVFTWAICGAMLPETQRAPPLQGSAWNLPGSPLLPRNLQAFACPAGDTRCGVLGLPGIETHESFASVGCRYNHTNPVSMVQGGAVGSLHIF